MTARPATPSDVDIRYRTLESPEGEFYFACDGRNELLETGWVALRSEPLPSAWRNDPRLRDDLASRLARALDGEAVDFSDVSLPGSGDFHLACRRKAQEIPAGETRSYADIAEAAGSPAAARAVGQAMRRNPTPIVVPCHRVVGADGALHGFGGATSENGRELGLKSALLRRERRMAQSATASAR